jgi:hypothetical protein
MRNIVYTRSIGAFKFKTKQNCKKWKTIDENTTTLTSLMKTHEEMDETVFSKLA